MKNDEGFTLIEVLIAIWCVFGVCVVIGLVCVAAHFIGKLW